MNDIKNKIISILLFFRASKKVIFALLILGALAYCGAIFFLYVWRAQPLNPDMKNISLDKNLFEKVKTVIDQREANLNEQKNFPDPFN